MAADFAAGETKIMKADPNESDVLNEESKEEVVQSSQNHPLKRARPLPVLDEPSD